MILVDTHVHFHFPDFSNDRKEAIERARCAGVGFFVNVGTDPETSALSLDLARHEAGFFASAGFHPHEASRFSSDKVTAWEDMARHEKIVAIGEVGLDFYRNLSSREDQESVFRAACSVARKVNKPLILHVRDAFEDVFRILTEEFREGWRGVFHCFSGDCVAMRRAVELGFHISFSGIVSYKRNDELRRVARETPVERILLETDAPYLPPQSKRGKRNESAYMIETAQCLADVRGVTLDEIARLTTRNASELFSLGLRSC